MQDARTGLRLKNTVIKTVLIFLASYLVFLFLWIQIKDYYGYAITLTASKIAAGIKDVRIEEMARDQGIVQATFSSPGTKSDVLIDVPVKTSSYTFNAPLTFGIMAALYLFITRKKRAYSEALLVLAAVHLFYVLSFEIKELTEVLIDRGLESASRPRLFVYQFLWSFTSNMVVRFEPFLIGFYMFLRFRKK